MRLTLPISTYQLPSPAASSARLVNCYSEKAPPTSGKGPVILRRAPGIRSWVELGDGPIRGADVMAGTLYVLSGSTLYSVTSQGAATSVGTISAIGDGRVRMSNNGTDLVIVVPGDNTGWHYDGSTLSQITDATFTEAGASEVGFIDGFLVFLRPGTAQFFNTGLNEVTFDGLDIATAEGQPDNLVGMMVDHRELILTGETSLETWYNAGLSPGSPFARTPDGLLEIGSAAPYSLGKADNSVFWLASDKTVRRLEAQRPARVSQHGVESVIQRMGTLDDAFAMTYTAEGHIFYVLTFPSEGRTFVYDATTAAWHERESLGYERWRVNTLISAYGMQLAGDSQSGKLGILDPDTHEEWGEPQRVEFTYQPIYAEANRLSHRRFELVLNAGHGVTDGQGENPLATLKVSDDGGNIFRTLPTRSLGPMGKYRTRAVWHNLGSARDRVCRVEITDPIPVFVVDTQVEVEGGRL